MLKQTLKEFYSKNSNTSVAIKLENNIEKSGTNNNEANH